MDPALVAGVLAQASAHFGLDLARAVPMGGMTGQVFALDDVVLRVGWPTVLDLEGVAAAAGATVVRVPEVLGRYDGPEASAVLLTRIDASPALMMAGLDPAAARRRGEACGRAQLALGTVAAPAGLPLVGPPSAVDDARLLHLDLHPLNILVGADHEVAAVLDWTNAAAGPPEYDRARTASILALDPAAIALGTDPRWVAFSEGWTTAASLHEVPAAAMAWACRYMLADLAGRYPVEDLAHVHAALERAEAAGVTAERAAASPTLGAGGVAQPR